MGMTGIDHAKKIVCLCRFGWCSIDSNNIAQDILSTIGDAKCEELAELLMNTHWGERGGVYKDFVQKIIDEKETTNGK